MDNNVRSILVLIADWDLVNQLDLKLNEKARCLWAYIFSWKGSGAVTKFSKGLVNQRFKNHCSEHNRERESEQG